MAADTDGRTTDPLVRELVALGRVLPGPAEDDDELVASVMTRVAALPASHASTPRARRQRWRDRLRRAVRGRQRAVAAVAAGLVVTLLLAPPVRAAVVDWLGVMGVVVRSSDDPLPPSAPPPPPAQGDLTLTDAAALVGFTPAVPAELGTPDGVEVSADRRVLSMTWDGGVAASHGPVRLDEFDGRLSPVFLKTVLGGRPGTGSEQDAVVHTQVGTSTALWFREPHEVAVLAEDGREYTEAPRLAGNTLIWELGDITLRLEGEVALERALAIAASTKPTAPADP